MDLLQFVISGALVGVIVGATGVGGGSLMTPLLTLVFGVPAQVAVGTDLLFASFTKAYGGFNYARRRQVPWSIVGWLALGSVPASFATLTALNVWHPNSAQFGALVRPSLGFALLLTATALLFRSQIQALGRRFSPSGSAVATTGNTIALDPLGAMGTSNARPLRTIAIGALIGTLVTLTSVGAGAIGVVALFFLYPALPARQLVGTDIVHAVPLTLVAGLGHAALGTVNWPMLGGLLIGSLPAIQLGAAIANRLPERVLRVLLAVILVAVGLRLFLV